MLTAFEESGQWQHAIRMLDQMNGDEAHTSECGISGSNKNTATVSRSVVAYTATITACAAVANRLTNKRINEQNRQARNCAMPCHIICEMFCHMLR